MNPRTTHTTTYFTCRWLVVVLAIFFFVDIHVLPARAQELPETTTETTQELDGQATTIEATQEQSGQVATTETTQESYNSQTITESGQQTNVIYDSIFDELNLDEVERALQQQGIQTAMPITEMVKKQVEGDNKSVLSALLATISSVFFGELSQNKGLLLELVGIVLIGSIFVNLSNSFAGGFISENGFYITYMLMTSLLLTSFSMAYSITLAALDKVLVAVRLLVPAFLLVLQFIGHATTAGGTYNLVLVGIWLIQAVIIRLVLPLIEFYVIVALVNNLQKEDSFSKLCELVQSLIKWILRTIIVVVIGLNVIKGLLEPQMDILGKTAVNRALTAIPGSVVSVLAGTYLACGMIVKNSIGITGILILSGICLIPIIKLFLLMFTVRITTALIQPMGDKRHADAGAGKCTRFIYHNSRDHVGGNEWNRRVAMLFGWMKSLIFYLLLATIVTHMAPSNQYKQYIRYFIGLVVIVLLASPLKFLFEFGSGDLQELLQEIEHVEGQESVAGVGGSITDYYGMGIREGLKKELQGYSVEDVAIITDAGGELLQCTIYISEAKATEEMEKEIKKYISDVYNLEDARIYVVRR